MVKSFTAASVQQRKQSCDKTKTVDNLLTKVYNQDTKQKEENTMPVYDENGNVIDVQEPEWGVLMFWEDITDILQKLWSLIKSLF